MRCRLLPFAALLGALAAAAAGAPAAAAAAGLVAALTRANDAWIAASIEAGGPKDGASRAAAVALAYQAASYAANPLSAHYRDPRLVAAMDRCERVLEESQRPDGYFDSASNPWSAPDTGFIIVPVCEAYGFLERTEAPGVPALRVRMERTIRLAGRALLVGGVQTANHRWGLCDGLAQIDELFPSPDYAKRIGEWLDEGLDADADGQWAERSPHYSGDVDDAAMLDLAQLLRRPDLLDAVRRNLRATVYLMEPDGELETVASRKPDQRGGSIPPREMDHPMIWEYDLSYRTLAVLDRDPLFAAMARFIERSFSDELAATDHPLNLPLVQLLERPAIAGALPPGGALPERYTKDFPLSALARIRRGPVTATIFGGTDVKLGLGEGPGLSSNPTFFKFRKGRAVLESVRMTPDFFDTGFFFSDGLAVSGDTYRLGQTLRVPYYGPLPKDARRPDGQYALTSDDRFSAAMDFGRRPRDYVVLKSMVAITERDGAFRLDFDVGGYEGVPVTIELTFGADGTLGGSGLAPIGRAKGRKAGAGGGKANEDFVLKSGFGRFQAGGDVIEFGPGAYAQKPGQMEGESYDWMNGNLRLEGLHVYLTGVTPFHHALTIR